jgi:hypothetical protein
MKYGLAFFAGLAVGAWFLRAKESSCCQRVAIGARDKLAGYTGALAPLTSTVLDYSGLTNVLPGLLDGLGVPKDA